MSSTPSELATRLIIEFAEMPHGEQLRIISNSENAALQGIAAIVSSKDPQEFALQLAEQIVNTGDISLLQALDTAVHAAPLAGKE